jgi:hypothetical protein
MTDKRQSYIDLVRRQLATCREKRETAPEWQRAKWAAWAERAEAELARLERATP